MKRAPVTFRLSTMARAVLVALNFIGHERERKRTLSACCSSCRGAAESIA